MEDNLDKIVSESVAWYKSLSDKDRAKVDVDLARPDSEKGAEFFNAWGKSDTNKDGNI